jgi:hypothetical protein
MVKFSCGAVQAGIAKVLIIADFQKVQSLAAANGKSVALKEQSSSFLPRILPA